MKRAVFLLVALLLPAIALGQDLPAKYIAALNEGGAGLSRGLTFHAPFTDPANPLKVYVGTAPTFARAHDATHTATYVHPTTGLVTVASADQLRIEAAGALVEGARANLTKYSEELSNSFWTVGTGCSVAVSADVDPFGGTGAFVVTDNDAANYASIYNTGANIITVPADSTVYTASVFIKKTVGATVFPGFGFSIVGGTNTHAHATLNTNTGVVTPRTGLAATSYGSVSVGYYWRAYATKANIGTADLNIFIYPAVAEVATPGTWSDAPVGSVVAFGLMVEAGGTMSSYVPTVATTMTRNADALTFPVIASPGTAIARVDGTMQEVDYATFNPVGHYVKDFREWDRTLSAAEIAAVVGP